MTSINTYIFPRKNTYDEDVEPSSFGETGEISANEQIDSTYLHTCIPFPRHQLSGHNYFRILHSILPITNSHDDSFMLLSNAINNDDGEMNL